MSSDCTPGSCTGSWNPERTLVEVLVKMAVSGAEVKDTDIVHCTSLKKKLKEKNKRNISESGKILCVPKLKRVSY